MARPASLALPSPVRASFRAVIVSLLVAIVAAASGCSSSGGPRSRAPATLAGFYRGAEGALAQQILFYDTTHYAMWRIPCVDASAPACLENGTFSVDAQGATLTLHDEVSGATSTFPLQLGAATSSTAAALELGPATQLAPRDLTETDGGTLVGGSGGLVGAKTGALVASSATIAGGSVSLLDPSTACDAANPYTVVDVTGSVAVPLFSDSTATSQQASVAPGTRLLRSVIVTRTADTPYSHVTFTDGSGTSGWMDSTTLALDSTQCGDQTAKSKLVERAQSPLLTSVPALVFSTGVACISGLGEGFWNGIAGQVTGVAHLVASGLSASEKLFYLYFYGSDQAFQDYVAAGEKKLQGAIGLVSHALPEIHNFLVGQYAYYEAQDTPGKAKYLCGLVGTTAAAIVVQLATAGAAGVWADAADASELLDANADLTEAFAVEGRVATSPVVDVPIDFASSQGADYWAAYASDLDQLTEGGAALDVDTQQKLIRDISDRIGVPTHAQKAGVTVAGGVKAGYCGNAAVSTMMSLGRGGLVCGLPYFDVPDAGNAVRDLSATLSAGGAEVMPWTYPLTSTAVSSALDSLEDGQMALLVSNSDVEAHATVAIKLKGVLYNINNQGWDTGSTLQTFPDWAARWETKYTGGKYGFYISNLKLPGY